METRKKVHFDMYKRNMKFKLQTRMAMAQLQYQAQFNDVYCTK